MNKTNQICAFALSVFFSFFVHAEEFDPLQSYLRSLVVREEVAKISSMSVEAKVTSLTASQKTTAYVLKHEKLGEVRFLKRDPIATGTKPLPVIFILSGLHTGQNAMSLVPETELSSVVTFDYPVEKAETAARTLIQVLKNLVRIEAQIVTTYIWLTQQENVDASRIISLNISFGSFLASPTLRILGQLGLTPAASIFAFGSANYFSVLNEQVMMTGEPEVQEAVLQVSKRLESLVKPEQFLKHLKGPFLVIYGTEDFLIPEDSVLSMYEKLPQPKTLVPLQAGHINADTPATIKKSFAVILNWLQGEKLL